MQPKLTIQERLKDLRVERGLTLEQLSAETGISKSALGKYEADDFKDISPFSMVERSSSRLGKSRQCHRLSRTHCHGLVVQCATRRTSVFGHERRDSRKVE